MKLRQLSHEIVWNVLESGSVLTVVRHYFYRSVKCHWKWSGVAVGSRAKL